jgi:hypothetical protein
MEEMVEVGRREDRARSVSDYFIFLSSFLMSTVCCMQLCKYYALGKET